MDKQKSTLESKLRNYSLLTGGLLAAAGSANAQVIHHTLNPSVVLDTNNAFYKLDLNGDGTADFYFAEFQSKKYGFAGLGLSKNNSIVGSIRSLSTFKRGYPSVLSTGNKIGTSNQWFKLSELKEMNGKYYYPELASSFGSTLVLHHGKWDGGETGKFVGLKVTAAGKSYYGWARITIPALSARSITIIDYAYESTPGASINAGDTSGVAGVQITELQNASVYASGKNVFVKYADAAISGMNIEVRDIQGKEIFSTQTNNESYELNLNNEAAGTYIVTVRSGNAQEAKKIVIQ
jgi:hypothetical protein